MCSDFTESTNKDVSAVILLNQQIKMCAVILLNK